MLTLIDEPTLPEALLMTDLAGNTQLLNLIEINLMSDDEKRTDEHLLDLKTLFEDPKTVKIVENVAEIIKLGERMCNPLAAESFVTIEEWNPKIRTGFLPTVKYEFLSKYERLVSTFQGKSNPGWKWDLQNDPEVLTPRAVSVGACVVNVANCRVARQNCRAPLRHTWGKTSC